MARPNVFGLIFKVDDSDQKKFKKIAKEVQALSGTLEKDLGGSILNLRNLVLGGGLAVGFKKMLDVGREFEDAQIGFKTLLGSATKAADVIAGIQEDAELTPFNFGSLVSANRALVSAGEDAGEARKAVLALGNALAASGKGSAELESMAVNLNQIKTLGKASAMDIKQFAFAGINIYEVLARGLGKNVEQVKKMDVSYDDLVKSLKVAASEGGLYFKGLENGMNSTTGKISNLEDKITGNLKKAFDKMQPSINSTLETMISLVDTVGPFIPQLIDLSIAAGLVYIAFAVGTAIGSIAAGVMEAYMGACIAAGSKLTLLEFIQWKLNAAIAANPVGIFIAALAALAVAGYLIYKNWDYLVAKAEDLWNWFKELYDSSETFKTALWALGTVAAIALSPVLIPIAAIAAALYGLYKAYQWVRSKISGDPIDVNANMPGMSSIPGIPGLSNAQSSNAGVINSNTTTTNRSVMDLNFSNLPQGTKVKQTGSAPGISVNTGLGLSM